jgi:hypothetical protein
MGQSDTVESLVDRIAVLRRERERLRDSGAAREELEENRRAIARAQSEFSLALIARHHRAA